MQNSVEVKLTLGSDQVAKLVSFADGEANLSEYTATIIQNLPVEGQTLGADANVENPLADPLLRIDLYG